jgi:hypothetical protein
MSDKNHISCVKLISDLIPYANNSRTHSDQQINQVASSIKEFGFTNPVLVDSKGGIIAGHGRVMAAKKLGIIEVPCVELVGLTEAQKKAYVIADNQLALNAEWDIEILKLEIETLGEMNFDVDILGFDEDFMADILGSADPDEDGQSAYTDKVEAPTYEPIGEKPDVKELYDDSKAFELVEQIKDSNLPQAEKDFLMLAAGRHTVLNFEEIANYYAHSSQEAQELMENSALVIIDFNKAIANGYATLSAEVSQQYTDENGLEDEE